MKQRKLIRTITQLVCFSTIIFISMTNIYALNSNKGSDTKNRILTGQNGKRIIHAVHLNDEIKIDGGLNELD